MNDYKNNYPTLLIHGFAGWGEDDGMSRNKWEFFRIYDEMFERARDYYAGLDKNEWHDFALK